MESDIAGISSRAAAYMPPSTDAVIQMRAGQRRLFQLVERYRLLGFIARRQYGKTTTCANIALMKMMRHRDHTVIFGSAKLNLSREIVRKEAAVFEKAINAAMARVEEGKMRLADDKTGKALPGLTHDDFADLFEHSRLEFSYYHTRTCYSRTKVVALRPDTVGETGDLMCDEVGRINNWKEVWEAVEPIVASNPQFRILLLTTPPPDDTHYSFEQLAPPPDATATSSTAPRTRSTPLSKAPAKSRPTRSQSAPVPPLYRGSGPPGPPA